MNLNTALTQLASHYDLDADKLAGYAEEDAVGGYHTNPDLAAWPMGSLWAVEGQVLYALIRATRPDNVLELGSYAGCSTAHIEAALKKNRKGSLVAVDSLYNGQAMTHTPGKRVEVVTQDAVAYLKKTRAAFDLIFEDLTHETDLTAAVWREGRKRLADGGLFVSHDAAHYIVGEQVQAGIVAGGVGDALTLLVEPSDCGLAVWRNA